MITRKSSVAATPSTRIKRVDSNKLDSPHFYHVVIRPLEQGMKIPNAFMKNYGDSLKKFAILKAQTGAKWTVSLRNIIGETWLSGKGLKEFGECFSIEREHVLVFRYRGNSRFHVLIFDNTATEIEYPVTEQRAVENDGSYGETSHESPPQLNKENTSNDERAFEYKYPIFIITVNKSNINRPYLLHLPISFVRDNFDGNFREKFKVRVLETGKTWSVVLDIAGEGGKFSKIFGHPGWKDFVQENGLKLGDTCAFEMVQEQRVFNFYRVRK